MARKKGQELTPEQKARAAQKKRYKEYLRLYITFSPQKRMSNESFGMLKEAINYLHPEPKQRGTAPLTLQIIEHLKECREEGVKAKGMDILDEFGLGLKGMRDVIKDAIQNHQIWIEDSTLTDKDVKPSRVEYWIVSEGEEPEGWKEKGGYVYIPRKKKKDGEESDDDSDEEDDDDDDDDDDDGEDSDAAGEVFGE